jgi:hypothetical protein
MDLPLQDSNESKRLACLGEDAEAGELVLGTIFLGSSLVTCSLLWNILLRNRTLISFDFIFETCWWFSGAFVTVFIEWKLQESRFRLPPKADSLL